MPLTIYDASVPVFTDMLNVLSRVLDKTAAYAAAKKIDPSVLLTSRLFPDMFPLSRQFQSASDNAKGPSARLAGVEVPSYPDTEKTIDELKVRLQKTVDFVQSLDRKAIEAGDDRNIVFTSRGKEQVMKGRKYLFSHGLPNFYFHASTAYAILRHNGLELGKRDFLPWQALEG